MNMIEVLMSIIILPFTIPATLISMLIYTLKFGFPHG